MLTSRNETRESGIGNEFFYACHMNVWGRKHSGVIRDLSLELRKNAQSKRYNMCLAAKRKLIEQNFEANVKLRARSFGPISE